MKIARGGHQLVVSQFSAFASKPKINLKGPTFQVFLYFFYNFFNALCR